MFILIGRFVLRNVKSDSDVINLTIKAVNKAKLLSENCKIDGTFHTLEASRYKQLLGELKLAKEAEAEYIDTDFIGGIQQRIGKKEYIKTITDELKKTMPNWMEEEEALVWANIKVEQKKKAEEEAKLAAESASDKLFGDDDDEEDEEKTALSFIFPFRARRAHFKHKIQQLEKLLIDLKNER